MHIARVCCRKRWIFLVRCASQQKHSFNWDVFNALTESGDKLELGSVRNIVTLLKFTIVLLINSFQVFRRSRKVNKKYHRHHSH